MYNLNTIHIRPNIYTHRTHEFYEIIDICTRHSSETINRIRNCYILVFTFVGRAAKAENRRVC